MIKRQNILTIIAEKWCNAGKCFWTSSRYVSARIQGPETTWSKLNDRLEPSCKTWTSVSSLKCVTSMAQRASEGLLESLSWLRQEKLHKQPEKALKNQEPEPLLWLDKYDLTPGKEKFTFLVAVRAKKRFQLFPDFSSRRQDALSTSEQHCSSSNGRVKHSGASKSQARFSGLPCELVCTWYPKRSGNRQVKTLASLTDRKLQGR